MVTESWRVSHVRGGILDLFSPDAEHAVRIDFFGDEVNGLYIRPFSVSDQQFFETPLDAVTVLPSSELLLTEALRDRARELAPHLQGLSGMLEKISEGIPVEGMESLAPVLVDELLPLTSYLPEDAGIAVFAPERVASRAKDLQKPTRSFCKPHGVLQQRVPTALLI